MPENEQKADPYFKKNIPYRYKGHNLNFRVSQALFSSQDIDVGTKRLLRTITDGGFDNYEKVLDLGCGYGPIGIALKSDRPSSEVHMVDRDALALDYSRQNAKLNKVEDIKIYGSLGYDDVLDNDFDLIVSNIPAKVGDRVLTHILKDSRFYLRPGGSVAVVAVDAIGDYVTRELADANIKTLFHKSWPGHLVFHYEFLSSSASNSKPELGAFEGGAYDRDEKVIDLDGLRIPVKTTYNLPEFDTLSYETELLLEALKVIKGEQINRAVVFNPGQGFVPVALSKLATVEQVDLIDRDLQALRTSRRNLVNNGYLANSILVSHQVGIARAEQLYADCIVGVLSEKDNREVHAMFVRQAAAQLNKKGLLILASSSTAITRITTLVRSEKLFNVYKRWKSRDKSVIILRPRL